MLRKTDQRMWDTFIGIVRISVEDTSAWHYEICETLPLLAQNLDPNPIPLLAQTHKKSYPLMFKSGLLSQFLAHSAGNF